MGQVYTVEIDGKQYDIEGDRPPTEAEARAAVQSYKPEPAIAKQAGAPGPQWPGAARLTPENKQGVADTLSAIGEIPKTAALGMMGASAGSALVSGAGRVLGPTVGRLVSKGVDAAATPTGGAVLGAAEGYLRGGLPTAISDAMLGALGGGRIGRIRTAAKASRSAPSAAREALSSMSNNIVLSPTEIAAKDQLMELAKQEARQAGMVSAGTKARGPVSLIEQLFGQ